MPRFDPATFERNLALLPPYEALAAEAGCTPAQLALAWLLAQGDDVIPIPGTTSLDHLREDIAAWDVTVPAELLRRAGDLINQQTVHGPRYNAQSSSEVDTEVF